MNEANDQVPTTGSGSNDLFGADAVASAENKLVEPVGATHCWAFILFFPACS